jgi:hypothetical protein
MKPPALGCLHSRKKGKKTRDKKIEFFTIVYQTVTFFVPYNFVVICQIINKGTELSQEIM